MFICNTYTVYIIYFKSDKLTIEPHSVDHLIKLNKLVPGGLCCFKCYPKWLSRIRDNLQRHRRL